MPTPNRISEVRAPGRIEPLSVPVRNRVIFGTGELRRRELRIADNRERRLRYLLGAGRIEQARKEGLVK